MQKIQREGNIAEIDQPARQADVLAFVQHQHDQQERRQRQTPMSDPVPRVKVQSVLKQYGADRCDSEDSEQQHIRDRPA